MSLPRVLFVDDEANILQSVRRVMRKSDVEIETTTDAGEALRMVAANPFAVVISDQRMPRMEGVELLEKVRVHSPDTVRIILTGYADVQASVDAINKGAVYRYLNKPWEDDDLRNTIRQAVDQYLLVKENKRLQELTGRQNDELKDLNENLRQKVMERTWEVLRLNQQLEHSFMGAVQAMARLGEMHSTVVGSHAKRVALLSTEMAKRLKIEGRNLMQVEVAATLHDIGKTLIHPVILKKAESDLEVGDRAILREHPVHGEAIVRLVPNNEDAAVFVRHHHERFDGKGFPDGLAGTDIPLGARIIAVANAYDKLLNSRSSFSSSTPAEAMRVAQGRVHSEFDPVVLEALQEVIRDIDTQMNNGFEIEIDIPDLRPGMVLSRDLKTPGGDVLALKNHAVEPTKIADLKRTHEKEPILGGLFVYRKWPRSGKRAEQRVAG